jgi:hypothetical protein
MRIFGNRLFLWSLVSSVALLVGAVQAMRRRRGVAARMRQREGAQEPFVAHFPQLRNPQVPADVQRILGRHLKVDLSKLLPGDTFIEELGFGADGEPALLKFIYELEGVFDVSLPAARDCLKLTVGELVVLIDDALAGPRGPGAGARSRG